MYKVLSLEYIAGFLDADGDIHLRRKTPTYARSPQYLPVVSFCNTKVEILLKIQHSLASFGIEPPRKLSAWTPQPNSKQGYDLCYTGHRAVKVAVLLTPLLQLKREQAVLITQFEAQKKRQWEHKQRTLPVEENIKREVIWSKIRELNRRGVELKFS